MELKEKTALSREEAAVRLHAIADELAAGNDVVIESEDIRFVAHVPDQVHLKVEFEIEDDGTELEIELTWQPTGRWARQGCWDWSVADLLPDGLLVVFLPAGAWQRDGPAASMSRSAGPGRS